MEKNVSSNQFLIEESQLEKIQAKIEQLEVNFKDIKTYLSAIKLSQKTSIENDYRELDREIKTIKENLVASGIVPNEKVLNQYMREEELSRLEDEKEKLLDQIEAKADAYYEENLSQRNYKTAKNFSELQELLAAKISEPKHASILLTCTMEMVSLVESNEFDNINWLMKVSENKTHYGARIRFTDIETNYLELRKLIKKKILDLKSKFINQNIDIITKTKTQPGEVVKVIEFTFKFKKQLVTKVDLGRQHLLG